MMAPAPSFLSWASGSAHPHRWRRQSWTFSATVFCPPCGSGFCFVLFCFPPSWLLVFAELVAQPSQPPVLVSRQLFRLFLGDLPRSVACDDGWNRVTSPECCEVQLWHLTAQDVLTAYLIFMMLGATQECRWWETQHWSLSICAAGNGVSHVKSQRNVSLRSFPPCPWIQ